MNRQKVKEILKRVEKLHLIVIFLGKNAQKTKKIDNFFCSFNFFA